MKGGFFFRPFINHFLIAEIRFRLPGRLDDRQKDQVLLAGILQELDGARGDQEGVAGLHVPHFRVHVHAAPAFPPTDSVLKLAGWLVAVHTGQAFAYPVGASYGGSLLTSLACLVGVVVGPMALALFLTMVRFYRRDVRQTLAEAAANGGPGPDRGLPGRPQ